MSTINKPADIGDPVLAYYRTLRDALLQARSQAELQDPRFRHGVEQVLNDLAQLILERRSPADLADVRKLDPELREGGILFALDKLHNGESGDLGWLSDRLADRGGAESMLSDPEVRSIRDLDELLSNYEEWRA